MHINSSLSLPRQAECNGISAHWPKKKGKLIEKTNMTDMCTD